MEEESALLQRLRAQKVNKGTDRTRSSFISPSESPGMSSVHRRGALKNTCTQALTLSHPLHQLMPCLHE